MSSTIIPQQLAANAVRAITVAGGGAKLARALGIKRAAVHGWKTTAIPAARVPAVSRITGIPLHELRPDLYEGDAPPANADAVASRRDPADMPARHPMVAA
ncbi:MAG: helix-turn-helix domain-containing protein [Roseomonas sp.]|nr:helix-turn-helix domain-containing protein [Roseomonas sp.]